MRGQGDALGPGVAQEHPVEVVGEAMRQGDELQAGAGEWETSEQNSIQDGVPEHNSQM
jgi:hypothetical protein